MFRLIKDNLYIACIFCVCLLLLPANSGYALPSDKEQVMQVTADSAHLSQQQHEGTYTGNVVFIQGTTNLRAALAKTLGNDKNQLSLAVAYGAQGKQAHYWTETGADKPPFHAYADTIKYYPLTHIIKLVGHAKVSQGQNSLSAAVIIYDTEKQHVLTQSDKTMRTTIILYPKQKTL